MNTAYIFSGFAVGMLVGLTGVGGGSLMTPLLVFMFGFKPVVAVGTDLLFAALTKTAGVWVHHDKHGSVDWQVVGWMSVGSLPLALATIFVLKHLIALGRETTGMITFTLGIALILTACALLVRSVLLSRSAAAGVMVAAPIQSWDTALPAMPSPSALSLREGRFAKLQIPATILIGAVLGVLVTLSSVGAGALGTVALLFLFPRMRTIRVVGTDLAHAIPLTAVAGLGHLSLGHVDLVLLGSLLIGSLPGIWIGSQLSAKVPERFLRPILATVLLLIGLKFVMQ